jgi:hypothetical protein
MEHLARLNYKNATPISDLLDVATYVPEHNFFHMSDGRICVAWQISGVPDEMLSTEEKFYFTDALAYALNQYPVGSCGQIIRYTHADIRARLQQFASTISDAPFAEDIIDSVIQRQISGAIDGFFCDITKDMIDAASAAQSSELEDITVKDSFNLKIENSTHTGRYAHVSDIFLTFCYSPSWMAGGHIIQSLRHRLAAALGIGGAANEYERIYNEEVTAFLGHVTKIQNALAKHHLSPMRVTGQGLVEVLYRELNPERKLFTAAPAYSPRVSLRALIDGAFRNAEKEIPRAAVFTGIDMERSGWRIGDDVIRVTSLRELPGTTRPGMLNEALSAIEGESWSAINFHVGNQQRVRMRLKFRRTTLTSRNELAQASTFMKPDPYMMQKNFQDLALVEHATNPEERDIQKVVDASVHIAPRGRNPEAVEHLATELEDLMWHYGYREKDRGDAIIHSMIPFNFKPQSKALLQRSRDILTSNLADMAPIFLSYQGVDAPTVLVNNSKGEPIYISLLGNHVTAGHALVVGGTGSGKSFLINNLIMQMTAKLRPKTFVIDKGNSYKSLCAALGGSYISLAVENEDDARPVCINPFYVSPDKHGKPRPPRVSEAFFMHRVILSMIQSGTGRDTGIDAGLSKEDSSLLFRALREMFERAEIWHECTLSEYVAVLCDFGGERGQQLAQKLHEFTKEGIYGALFDGPIEVNWDADMIVIETDKLDGSAAMPVIMLVLFYQIDLYCKYRLPRDRMKYFLIDEAWAALSDPSGVIPRLVGGYFREMRKYSTACCLVSQSLGDFATLVSSESKSGGGKSGILVNTMHYFLLSSSEEDVSLARSLLNISDVEANQWRKVSSLPPFYSECFYRLRTATNQPYSGIFRLYSSPVAIWLASTEPSDITLRERTIKNHLSDSNGDRITATRRAVRQLSQEYPYGSRYAKKN